MNYITLIVLEFLQALVRQKSGAPPLPCSGVWVVRRILDALESYC